MKSDGIPSRYRWVVKHQLAVLAYAAEQGPDRRATVSVSSRAPVPGLYLCGSGTHPGGELTGAPGYNCARAILRDLEARADD